VNNYLCERRWEATAYSQLPCIASYHDGLQLRIGIMYDVQKRWEVTMYSRLPWSSVENANVCMRKKMGMTSVERFFDF
jgi:hypothetical protein